MGNSFYSELQRQLGTKKYQWQVLSSSSYSSKLRDRKSGLLAQRHHIQFNKLQQQYKTYLIRHRFNQYLVDIYQISQEKSQNLCTINPEVSIIIEYIPYRLSDLGAISLQEGLYVMSCVLRACQVLKHNEIQFYFLDQVNICFNEQGQCKFWIHENLFKAKPERTRITTEKDFILTLWEIIEQRVNQANTFFTEDLSQIRDITIEQMKKMVDKALTIKLVALPSIISLNTEQSPPKNIFLDNDIFPLKSQREETKKVSLTNYNSKYKMKDENRSRGVSQQNIRTPEVSTPKKKTLSSREKNSCDLIQHSRKNWVNQGGELQMKKMNTNSYNEEKRFVPIDPYYSVLMVSPASAFRNNRESFGSNSQQHYNIGKKSPMLKFSYESPGNHPMNFKR